MPSAEAAVVVGVVDNIQDPERLGRVRVRLPHLADQLTYWARLATLMAGPDRGSLFRPEVGDEVLVAFAHGDDHQPYVLGALWNSQDKPPENGGNADNDLRVIKSRSGHIIRLNDTQGGETIEIIDKSGSNSVIIDTAANKITVAADMTVVVEAKSIEVTGQTEVKVSAPTIEVSAESQVKVSAQIIEISAKGSMTLDGGPMLTLKGGMVKIN